MYDDYEQGYCNPNEEDKFNKLKKTKFYEKSVCDYFLPMIS